MLVHFYEEHEDNPLNIVNAESMTSEEFVQGLLSGKHDAAIATKRDVEKHNKHPKEERTKQFLSRFISFDSMYYI